MNLRESMIKKPEAVLASQRNSHCLTIGEIEKGLSSFFKPEWAESWDTTGLLVGDPRIEVTKIALGLDVTLEAIRAASHAGANLLLTHHPAYLKTDGVVRPDADLLTSGGAYVWEAMTSGVALMNYHTALDVSPEGALVLPNLLNLQYERPLVYTSNSEGIGFGSICALSKQDASMTLRQMAARCMSVFGREPRVWGDFGTSVGTIATWGGSTGGLITRQVAQQINTLIIGEVKYHEALALCSMGLSIIELGHDVSELPLTLALSRALLSLNISEEDIILLDQSHNWLTPLSTRL